MQHEMEKVRSQIKKTRGEKLDSSVIHRAFLLTLFFPMSIVSIIGLVINFLATLMTFASLFLYLLISLYYDDVIVLLSILILLTKTYSCNGGFRTQLQFHQNTEVTQSLRYEAVTAPSRTTARLRNRLADRTYNSH